MKKIILTIAIIVSVIQLTYAQWSGTTDIYYTGGNVGIGTAAPTNALTIGLANAASGVTLYNNAAGLDNGVTNYERVTQSWAGNIFTIGSEQGGTGSLRAIRLTGPLSSLTLGQSSTAGSITLSHTIGTANARTVIVSGTQTQTSGVQSGFSVVQTINQTSSAGYRALFISPFEQGTGSGNKYLIDAGINSAANGLGTHTSYLRLTDNGNMGIATADVAGPTGWKLANSAYRLCVGDGGIQTTTVNVQLVGAWGDYVFKKDYKLLPLADLKVYVDQNHHLPEVPSAEQIAKGGLNLGEMNKILVKKVEELTLYMIEKDNQLKAQQAKNDELESKLNAQQAQIDTLLKAVEVLTNKVNVKN